MGTKKILLAGAACAVFAAVCGKQCAYAAADALHSRGNTVLQDGGGVAFYAEDIRYLQEELDRLFSEIG